MFVYVLDRYTVENSFCLVNSAYMSISLRAAK